MFVDRKQVLDFREIRRVLWRRKLLVVLPILVTLAAAAVRLSTMPPMYRSQATLAWENPASFTRRVAEMSGEGGGHGGDALIRRRLNSSSFLETVAVQIGLHENPALRARAELLAQENPGHEVESLVLRQCVGRLRAMLRVQINRGGILVISAESTSPRLAYVVAEGVTEQWVHTIRETRLTQSEEAYKFAREQMAIYEAQLEDKRRQLREYQQEMALKPLSSSPVSAENMSRVSSLLAGADADLEFQTGRREAIRARIQEAGLEAFVGLGVIESSKAGALRQTLYELERNLALALVEYPDDSGPVVGARNQIAVKSQQLLTEMETLAANALPSLVPEYRQLLVDHEYMDVSLRAAQARKEELRAFLSRYAADLASMPAEEFRLARLTEDVESATRLYQTWLDQANATQIAKAVRSEDVGNRFQILEPATQPLAPFAPDAKKILLVAFAMGIALGLVAAVVTEYFDLTLKSVEDIEAVMQVPILGAVPRMQSAVMQELEVRRRRRVWVFAASSVLTLAALAAVGYLYFNR